MAPGVGVYQCLPKIWDLIWFLVYISVSNSCSTAKLSEDSKESLDDGMS